LSHLTPVEGALVRSGLLSAEEEVSSDHQALIDRQQELEDHMLGMGALRFKRNVSRAMERGEATTAGAGVKLLREAIEPVEKGIQALLDGTGSRGPKHLAVRWLGKMDPATAAYITARAVIDGIHAITPLRVVATEIAGTLLDELRYRRLQKARPALFRYKMERLPGTNYKHNKAVLDQTLRWASQHSKDGDDLLDVSDLVMTEQHRLLVGSKLIDIFASTTGLVTVVSQTKTLPGGRKASKRKRLKQELYLTATPATKDWMNTRNDVLEMLTPVNLPMLIPPRPWSHEQRGGYLFGLRNKYDFVRGASKAQRQAIADAEIPLVYEALNTIQETAWKLNRAVFELVEEILAGGRVIGNLPMSDIVREPLPAKPVDIATNEEARRRYRKDARAIHEKNHARMIRTLGVSKTLLAARQVVEEDRIYFPCSLDFRGRIYPLTHYLNPQGDDLSKALLTFAEGKPLGPDGARWLAIHGANCLDETSDGLKVKTMTLDERVQWIEQHSERIVAVADDPYADLWWTDADEPLQFYAFCIEWRGYKAQGESYVCSLPVSQDGSCNGLQHFSALLRDPVGGHAVNLTAEVRPQDLYDKVLQRVLEDVNRAANEQDDWIAQRWLATGLLKRKLVKRPTMTFCYGSRQFGMASQTLAYLQEDKKDWQKVRALFTDEDGDNRTYVAAQWMADVIWFALQETVVAASAAMDWMQDCAKLIVSAEKPVQWTVPVTGFPVRQEYYTPMFQQVRTVIAGQIFWPSTMKQGTDLLTHRQVNAVSPNVIHSFDAAVLMLTVVAASKQGIDSFGMVHDSYATVPADCSKLAKTLRQVFVEFYRDNDVIGHLFQAFLQSAPIEASSDKQMPVPPSMGTLDINQVMDSLYFFN
jgi:DNA-directed RNA polymerase